MSALSAFGPQVRIGLRPIQYLYPMETGSLDPQQTSQPQTPGPEQRDYSTISPSAKALLLMKGFTQIPYPRKAAELISAPEPFEPDFSIRIPPFWIRVM